MKWYYTRGQCEGDVRKVWVGTAPPDRKEQGREISFYPNAHCHCLFAVISWEQFEVIAKLPKLLPGTCHQIPALFGR
jgi:hypothetical protein